MSKSRKMKSLLAAIASIVVLLAAASGMSFADGNSLKLDMWRPGDEGQRLLIRGRVSSASGQPIANATIHIRQADGTGVYTEQYQGSLQSGPDGSYAFGTIMPGQYTSTKHIHIFVSHDDYSGVSTEIRFKGDPNLDGGSYDENAIVTEEATVDGKSVLLGEFNIVM